MRGKAVWGKNGSGKSRSTDNAPGGGQVHAPLPSNPPNFRPQEWTQRVILGRCLYSWISFWLGFKSWLRRKLSLNQALSASMVCRSQVTMRQTTEATTFTPGLVPSQSTPHAQMAKVEATQKVRVDHAHLLLATSHSSNPSPLPLCIVTPPPQEPPLTRTSA